MLVDEPRERALVTSTEVIDQARFVRRRIKRLTGLLISAPHQRNAMRRERRLP